MSPAEGDAKGPGTVRPSPKSSPGELGELLKAWRSRLRPVDVGMPAGLNRKVQGLRRAEVAVLAGMSTEYVERLEQGRSVRPSPEVVEALSRVLQLSRDERDHFFLVAGLAHAREGFVSQFLSPGALRLMERLDDVPVGAFDASWTFILGNRGWRALFGDPTFGGPKHGRNLAWMQFTGALGAVVLDAAAREAFEGAIISDLRVTRAQYPMDTDLEDLIHELQETSASFARLWAAGNVVSHASDVKTIAHPLVGDIELDCDIVYLPGSDSRLVAYTARPNTDAVSKLQLALTVGQRQFEGTSD